MKKIIRSIVLAALLVAALCTLSGCGKKAEINLADYITVSFSGMDGEGKANCRFDTSSFELDIYSQVKTDKNGMAQAAAITKLERSLSFNFNKPEGLSNGDKVKLSVGFDKDTAKECSVVLNYKEETFEVSDLKEPIEIDPFDPAEYEVFISGVAPYAWVDWMNHGEKMTNTIIRYDYSKEDGLCNGDVITITASLDPRADGYVLSRNEMTYTVEGLNMVPQNVSDLTSDNIRQLKDICLETVENRRQSNVNVGNTSYYSSMMEPFDNIRLGSTGYLCVNRADVFFVVPVSITLNNVSEDYDINGTFDVHGYVTVKGFSQSADGSLLTDTLYAETQGFSFNDGEALNNYLASFNADWVQTSGNIG